MNHGDYMIDKRTKYQDKVWETHCMFAYRTQRGWSRNTVYDETVSKNCYANDQGYKLVFSFGSDEECAASVKDHNNQLKIKNLLLENV